MRMNNDPNWMKEKAAKDGCEVGVGANMYVNSPEIHAAVNTVADIVMYAQLEGDNLHDKLIEFFGSWDRARTDQIESLKARLLDAYVFPRPVIWEAPE